MRESFYHFILNERDPGRKDAITSFAYSVEKDGTFPKTSKDYNEISHYLELNGDYLPSMRIFDEAWERYIDEKHS